MLNKIKTQLFLFSMLLLLTACGGGGGGGTPEGTTVFSVTPSAGVNGNISPDKPVQVAAGATKLFRINSTPGFTASVGGTCPGTLIESTYTVGPITGDCTVSASFSPITYTVNPISGQNGVIKPSTTQSVVSGSPSTFEIIPNFGYSSNISVSGCGGTLSGNFFTTAPITGNCTVSASFSPNQYNIASRAIGGGRVSCQTPVTLGGGSSCTITPDTGYQLFALSDNGANVFGQVSGNIYSLSGISGDHEVVAAFTLKQFNVVPSTTNGTLSPSTTQTVPYGSTKDFVATPNNGYAISAVSGNCGGTLSGSTYTTAPVTGDCISSIAFSHIAYTVATSPGTGGSLTATSQQPIYYNSTPSYTITPSAGYSIISVSGCGGTLSGNFFTTAPITGDCTVSASFNPNQYNVASRATGGGQVSCQTPVTLGGGSACTITPDTGYQLFALSDNGANVFGQVSGNIYSLSGISGDHDVVAAFTLKQFSVAPSATNGTLSPSTPQTAPYGSTRDFVATPNTGYAISAVSGNCGGTLSGSTYTTAPVTGNCTSSVSFSPIAFTVVTSAGTGGSLTATSQQPIYYNSTPSYTVTPGSGHNIASVSGCGGSLSGNTFTTAPIKDNCTVSANFTPIQYSTGILSLSVATKPSSLGFLEVDIPLPSGVQPASMTTPGESGVYEITALGTPSPVAATYTESTNTIKLLFLNYDTGIGFGSLATVNLSITPSTFVTQASFPSFATVVTAGDASNNIVDIPNPSQVITIPLSVTLN